MRGALILAVTLVLAGCGDRDTGGPEAAAAPDPDPVGLVQSVDLTAVPVFFEANRGQAPAAVRYLGRTRAASLLLLDDQVAAIASPPRARPAESAGGAPPEEASKQAAKGAAPARRGGFTFRMRFAGARADLSPRAELRRRGRVNYFIGSDPSAWVAGVPTFEQVRYPQAWPGIDVFALGSEGRARFDFQVAPGADPGAIALAFEGEGVEKPRVDERGSLVLAGDGAGARLPAPRLHQSLAGRRVSVEGGWRLERDGTVGFRVGAYDPSAALIIDPVIDFYWQLRSNLEGEATSFVGDAVLGPGGDVYVAGKTDAYLLPTAQPPASPDPGYLVQDLELPSNAFVLRLAGTARTITESWDPVVYLTYLGGRNGDDDAEGIDVAPDGAPYVAGWSRSPPSVGVPLEDDFPIAAGSPALPADPDPPSYRAFVTWLDPQGRLRRDASGSPLFSRWVGYGRASDLVLDGQGVYVAANPGRVTKLPLDLSSADWEIPVGGGIREIAVRGGRTAVAGKKDGAGFAALVEPDGSDLVYLRTYTDPAWQARSVVFDAAGNAQVAVYPPGFEAAVETLAPDGSIQALATGNENPLYWYYFDPPYADLAIGSGGERYLAAYSLIGFDAGGSLILRKNLEDVFAYEGIAWRGAAREALVEPGGSLLLVTENSFSPPVGIAVIRLQLLPPALEIWWGSPPWVRVDDELEYAFRVGNGGDDLAEDVAVEVTLPGNVHLEGTSGCLDPPPAASAGVLTCELGAIPGGERRLVEIRVTGTDVGEACAVADASASNAPGAADSACTEIVDPRCGNDVPEFGEECDEDVRDVQDGLACDYQPELSPSYALCVRTANRSCVEETCVPQYCGDGQVQTEHGEQCDPPGGPVEMAGHSCDDGCRLRPPPSPPPTAELSIRVTGPPEVSEGESFTDLVTVGNAGRAPAEKVIVVAEIEPTGAIALESGPKCWPGEPHRLRCEVGTVAGGTRHPLPISARALAAPTFGEAVHRVWATSNTTDTAEDERTLAIAERWFDVSVASLASGDHPSVFPITVRQEASDLGAASPGSWLAVWIDVDPAPVVGGGAQPVPDLSVDIDGGEVACTGPQPDFASGPEWRFSCTIGGHPLRGADLSFRASGESRLVRSLRAQVGARLPIPEALADRDDSNDRASWP